jgi:hypothetical protein
MCPILLIEYQVVQNGDEKHYSFGFVATSFQPVQMNVGPSNAALPAIVWGGRESVLGLVFPTEAARAKCIKRLGRDKPFGLSLERDLHDSFLLRNFSVASPGDDVELYQVQGKNHTIMSIRAGQRGFVVVDPTWSEPPRFVPYGSVEFRGCSGNWVFVLAGYGAKRPCAHIIECANSDVALDVAKSLTQRVQRAISVSEQILSVTTREIGHGDVDFAVNSHSETGQANRLPFNTAWGRFVKSISIPASFEGQGQILHTRGGAA